MLVLKNGIYCKWVNKANCCPKKLIFYWILSTARMDCHCNLFFPCVAVWEMECYWHRVDMVTYTVAGYLQHYISRGLLLQLVAIEIIHFATYRGILLMPTWASNHVWATTKNTIWEHKNWASIFSVHEMNTQKQSLKIVSFQVQTRPYTNTARHCTPISKRSGSILIHTTQNKCALPQRLKTHAYMILVNLHI